MTSKCRKNKEVAHEPQASVNYLGSKLVNLENLSSKITSSKPAVFSLYVLFLLVLFRSYIFSSGDAGLGLNGLNGIGFHFEILSSKVDPTRRELISCPSSNYVSVILH